LDVIQVRIASVSDPLAKSPRATEVALSLVSRAQVMGLLPDDLEEPLRLDTRLLLDIGRAAEVAGVATHAVPMLRRGADLEAALRATLEAIDASPHPSGEWGPARELLGDDVLSRLLGRVSASSIRRYAAGARETPDEIAWRLHVVARILAGLIGSYNAYGIRRWFDRPRTALDGRTPARIVQRAKHEDDPDLQQVIALADALSGAGAAS